LTATPAPAEGVGSGEVRLAWNAPVDNGGKVITDYRIEWSTTGDEWTVVDDGLSTATTFTVAGLANFTNHLFRVTAENGVGAGPSATIEATPLAAPGAPDGLTAAVAPSAGVGAGEVLLTWSSLPNGAAVTDYLVESSTDGVIWTAVEDGVSSVPRYTVRGLDNGTPYRFRVAAVNAVGSGEWSSPIVATPVGKPDAPGRPRAAVAPATGVGIGQAKLTWTAPVNNGSAVSDYVIQRSTDGTTWTTVNDGVSAATTLTVSRLANGTQYQFRVAAMNAGGQGDWSATVSATPRWKPAAPRELRATARARQVRLTWSAPASNGAAIGDYLIQRSTGRGWTTVRDGVSTARSYTVSGLTNGTSYRFRVAAKNAVGQGSWSAVVRSTPRAAR
jgi:titin